MQFLRKIGLEASHANTSLYVRQGQEHALCVVLYVDDLDIMGADPTDVNRVKSQQSNMFEMKDLGKVHYFLGIEVIQTPSGLLLTQCHYALNMLFKFGMTACKSVATPVDRNEKLQNDPSPACDHLRFRQIIRGLIYLTIPWPDLSYPTGLLSQFM